MSANPNTTDPKFNETLIESCNGSDYFHSSSNMVEELNGSGQGTGLERENGGGVSNKAVIGGLESEGGNLVESLDWVMKAAELLVGDADDCGGGVDIAAIAEGMGLRLKGDVANTGVLGVNLLRCEKDMDVDVPRVDTEITMGDQEESVPEQGKKVEEEIVVGLGENVNTRLCKDSDLIGKAVDSGSLRSEGVSYYSLIQEFFEQSPYKDPVTDPNLSLGGSSTDFENQQMNVQSKAELNEKRMLKGDVSKKSRIKSDGVDLVVDFNTYISLHGNGNKDIEVGELRTNLEIPQDIGKRNKVKPSPSESAFSVSKLVWGKIRSHPWWPGQIFDPSYASKKSMKYCKKNTSLIAYFGDGTFAWNEASMLKPFGEHFSQMEKQSNTESFLNAVDCALEEVARRVEFSLTCPCLSKEIYASAKTQIIGNSGIRTKLRKRDANDEYSDPTSFEPAKLVDYIKSLAQHSYGVVDRLEHTIVQSQVLSISLWKGHPQLPQFYIVGGLLDVEEINVAVTDFKVEEQIPIELTKSKDGSSRKKRKFVSGDNLSSGRKKKSLSDLMSGNQEYFINCENELEEKTGNNQSNKVGDGLRRVVSKLKGSTPNLKASVKNKSEEKTAMAEKSQRKMETDQTEWSSPDEYLTQMCLAASGPMKGFDFITSLVNFISEFRNSVCLDHPTSGKRLLSAEITVLSEQECVEDSYWTDRIIQANPDDKLVLDKNEISKLIADPTIKMDISTIDSQAALAPSLGPKLDPEMSEEPMDENSKEEEPSPTALILNFADLDSVPLKTNLNEIFSRYGPLNESETEVLENSNRAKVVFKRRSDAETAFSSAGKYSIFGPSLVSYRLKYLPATPRKSSSPATKRSKKSSSEGDTN